MDGCRWEAGPRTTALSMIAVFQVFQESFLGFLGAVLGSRVVCSATFHLDFPSTNIADFSSEADLPAGRNGRFLDSF